MFFHGLNQRRPNIPYLPGSMQTTIYCRMHFGLPATIYLRIHGPNGLQVCLPLCLNQAHCQVLGKTLAGMRKLHWLQEITMDVNCHSCSKKEPSSATRYGQS